jgi:hypothetical protein
MSGTGTYAVIVILIPYAGGEDEISEEHNNIYRDRFIGIDRMRCHILRSDSGLRIREVEQYRHLI